MTIDAAVPTASHSGFTHRTSCILCGASRLTLAVRYPKTPIADAYLADRFASVAQARYPLDLWLCAGCGHLQLADVVDPRLLFSNYVYETKVSPGLVDHFAAYAEAMATYAGLAPGSLVAEIGSNDGSLLTAFRERGFRVLGVDPARAIADKATRAGIETVPDFFTSKLARELRERLGPATLVAANNVFAHSETLPDMAEGVRCLLAPDGIFSFEVSYLPDIVERLLFDTVYHEHLSYHAVTPLIGFLESRGLELVDFLPVSTKGGSFRGIAQLSGGPRSRTPAVEKQLVLEERRGITRPETFHAFTARIAEKKRELVSVLERLKDEGKRIAGFGASATVTTLLHTFGLHGYLDFLVDDNPRKHHTFAPGSTLEVLPSDALLERKPDAVLVLAWAYAQPIIAKHQEYRAKGGRFIVPLPTVEVL